ncbi:MAG: ABC transporter ATP-binding protein [Okeania sp. SIO2G4]|uniref:ABC transporter ATP-binding protein n=1 Tax=unclassified Okeania TaxID=2634635 RepID=UPI0013BB7512|nr:MULTISPECIES: ABC transporter ATP-binding protein [unclassified Okeania]NEP72529.1 ABC transporter ATP-binding protein [Okeania sp. SIO2G5]NEP95485.1 ABC transporter ATP-binding protein [Okeania sp. SIO2F5]NEQ91238.1 ABC transporter ATP-binding protein [Okeania sp. SIO2G4]
MLPDLISEKTKSILTTRKLTVAYNNGKPIILNLDLAIPRGKITVIVGPNGCGKSTLLKSLARLLKPISGTVYLESNSIFKLSTKEVAKQLAILPQSPTAPEGLTVEELVAQGRYPHQNWLQQWSIDDDKITQEALVTTGLLELAGRSLDSLSGGQRQRAWVAMALAQDTEILLLDEPTTFLDLAYQIELLDLLYDLNDSQGRTIVMVLHDLNQACRYGDNLIVLRDGQIVTQGTPDQVMTVGMVRLVFGLESQIIQDPVTGTPMCIPMGRKAKQKV